MPGLVPGIHAWLHLKDVDGRDNGVSANFVGGVPSPGHDDGETSRA